MSDKTTTPKRLVIVESPAKGKTIENYLGEGYEVVASVGHIRDLPQPSELPKELKKGAYGKFSVDVDDHFKPYYMVSPEKKKTVTSLKDAMKDADELYLASDGDREGEAIAWHLLEVLKPKIPTYRLVFPEITKEAIDRALDDLRDIDMSLVDAQETRRILDRIYGYEVSPVLWRKINRGLSAGRVQSVATRLIVARERERMEFLDAEYWDLTGEFEGQDSEKFTAKLTGLDNKKIATGKDFNEQGQLTTKDTIALDRAAADDLGEGLSESSFYVTSLESKPYTRRPQAPFTTSTLQQAASGRLNFSSRTTMRVAQNLYENGFITYMRTDSTNLSRQAISAARTQAKQLYGSSAVPETPRSYTTKTANAQEAHEAIRPAGDSFRSPKEVSSLLSGDQYRLYELIWQRTVASQMQDVKGTTSTVKIDGTISQGVRQGSVAQFSASGTIITQQGFLAAYGDVGGINDSRKTKKDEDKSLPLLKEGQSLKADSIVAGEHQTSPPARYTEASLIKQLEDLGIGRPSTYASTVSTIMDRGYVTRRGNALVPSWTAFSVTRLMEGHFGELVDYKFTADMEEDLDRIARGEERRNDWLTGFYFGDEEPDTKEHYGLKKIVDNLGDIDARNINSVPLGDNIVLRVGKFGPYLEHRDPEAPEDAEPVRANIPDDIAPDELTTDVAKELLEKHINGDPVLGVDPETGRDIVLKDGRYGFYVTEVIPDYTDEEIAAFPQEYYKNGNPKPKKLPPKPKPRAAGLFKSMSPESVTFEDAMRLLSLPRVVGVSSDGEEITAQNGPYGPYLKKGRDSRPIGEEEQVFAITLEEAENIYSQPKTRGGRQAQPPLAEFGDDPTSEKPIVIKDGRFGAYITDGETNVTVPRGQTIESITREHAISLIAEKRSKGPAPKKTTARKASPKKTPSKTTKK